MSRVGIAVAVLAGAILPALAQQTTGPQPGHGYAAGVDPDGRPFVHGVVDPGNMVFTTVTCGMSPTPALPAAGTSPRTKLYLLNASGRGGGSPVDAWLSYGMPAAIGQGFILMGYGDRVTEDMGATIDQRALSCIAASPVTITVGVVQG